jgi:hypothetical protein
MKFEEQLYEGVCQVFPATTVRSFSRWLGKSEGYWSSILAQQLPVSNGALGHLVDVLAVQRLQSQALPTRVKKISQLQELIAEEISNRAQCLLADFELRGLLGTERHIPSIDGHYGAMPFVSSLY